MSDFDPMMSNREFAVLIGALVGAAVVILTINTTLGIAIAGACLLYLFWKAI